MSFPASSSMSHSAAAISGAVPASAPDPAPAPANTPVFDIGKDEISAPTLKSDDSSPSPRPEATHPKQRWNHPRSNMFRFFVTLYSFIVLGMNDAAIGALIPYIEAHYGISYTVLSLIFLSSFAAYLTAALTNNIIHPKFGQRGIAFLGPLCHLVGYIALCLHPPFPALPVVMAVTGLGNGWQDSSWNAWVGNMYNANELLGLLHGAYGLGATIGPLIATSMVTKLSLPWWSYYYLMIGLAVMEFVLCVTAFWGATGEAYRESLGPTIDGKRTTTRTVLREPTTWLIAIFLLGYVGAEVSLGGWIVLFMLKVRDAENFPAGMAVTGFWLGLTVGRVVLGFITGRVGEKLAISGYLVLCIALELLYWLVPNFIASAIFVAFMGFFLGPLFPAAIVAAAKLLPGEYHVAAIGFAAAFGSGGAAIFPFAVGAIAQSKGVQVLQPIILAIFVFIMLVWWCLPGGLRPGGLERAREEKEKPGREVVKAWRWLRSRS